MTDDAKPVSEIIPPGQAIESSRRLDAHLTRAIEETKRPSLADVAARIRNKKAKHDMLASDWASRLDKMDAAEPALLDAGESVLAEREADMKEMERNIRVLGNFPFDSPKSLNGSHTDDERKKNE
jgi:cell pole-organizing protein PopZ